MYKITSLFQLVYAGATALIYWYKVIDKAGEGLPALSSPVGG